MGKKSIALVLSLTAALALASGCAPEKLKKEESPLTSEKPWTSYRPDSSEYLTRPFSEKISEDYMNKIQQARKQYDAKKPVKPISSD